MFKRFLLTSFFGLLLASIVCVAVAGRLSAANSKTLITPPDPEQTTILADRINSRKITYRKQIAKLNTKSLANRCSLAQAALGPIRVEDSSAATNRLRIYQTIADELNTTTDRLSRQGIDASSLVAVQVRMINGMNQYLVDDQGYKTAIDDMINMDCAADPKGFEATLLAARELRAKLYSEVTSIKAMSADLSKALGSLKAALSATQKGGQ